jgi:hypothetical protein
MSRRKEQTQWTCQPTAEGWHLKAFLMVQGIGVRCEVDLPQQTYAASMMPVIIPQMTDAIAEQKAQVMKHIEESHKNALEETEVAIEESGKTPTRH